MIQAPATRSETVKVDGETDLSQYVGRVMRHETWDGTPMFGIVESFQGGRPILRFADERWAYGDAPQTSDGCSELTFWTA